MKLGKTLQRVANVQSETLLAFRENTWHDTCVLNRIENKDGTLTMYVDKNYKLDRSWFSNFLEHLLPPIFTSLTR